VLHVPYFFTNLISLSKLLIDNPYLSINFTFSCCAIKGLHTKTSLLLPSHNGLYFLKVKSSLSVHPQNFLDTHTSTSIWHARLDHPSNSTTIKVINYYSLPCNKEILSSCHDCMQAKAHVLYFSIFTSTSTSSSPLDFVHSNIWGPSPIISSQGYKYYIIFVDDYSHFIWIYFFK
jgi:GAG-pre-integrase domain